MSTDPRPVVILGAGGHARVLREALGLLGVPVTGFIAPSADSRLGDLPWLGNDDALLRLDDGVEVVNGLGSAGSAERRVGVYARAKMAGLQFRTIVHPRAVVATSAAVGEGAQILAGAVVGVGVRIGADVIVNSGAVIDHDSVIGDHSHIAPGAVMAGDVVVGEVTHIGLGARIIQGITIGSRCIIGAGAVVLEDVADGVTAVGVPARRLQAERTD